MQKLTLEQAIVVSGYTGVLCCPSFGLLHEDIERRVGGPVSMFELMDIKSIRHLYREDFMAMIKE